MAAKLDIIQVGYAEMQNQSLMKASGSSCLIQAGGSKILFDTMGPWEKDLLIGELAKHNIHPGDINYLVCSHSHPDHIGNNNLFTRAKTHFVGTSVYEHDRYNLSCFEPCGSYTYTTTREEQVEVISYQDYLLESGICIQPTPGHTLECISLLIDNCDGYGRVALAGDLFERQEDIANESVWLGAGSQNSNLQRAHRARIYNAVDYIVPGHGPMFKTQAQKPVRF